MAKDRDKDMKKRGGGMRPEDAAPDELEQARRDEPESNDRERGQFAGGNQGIQDDKSQGRQADHGQRGGRGTEHTPGGST